MGTLANVQSLSNLCLRLRQLHCGPGTLLPCSSSVNASPHSSGTISQEGCAQFVKLRANRTPLSSLWPRSSTPSCYSTQHTTPSSSSRISLGQPWAWMPRPTSSTTWSRQLGTYAPITTCTRPFVPSSSSASTYSGTAQTLVTWSPETTFFGSG